MIAVQPKSLTMPQQPSTSAASTTLKRALDKNATVKDSVKQAADELLVVNAVLKHEIPGPLQTGEVAQALQKTGELEGRIQASADDLVKINHTLEQEVDERADLERELATTKAALAETKRQRS